MESHVRELRDQFLTRAWSRQLYIEMYFSPERESVENSVIFSQQNVTGQVVMMAYKGNGRQSPNISFRCSLTAIFSLGLRTRPLKRC